MSSEYDRYEHSTPITLTVQGDAGGFQVALEAHVDDHDAVDAHLDRMRRAFIRQEAFMRLVAVQAECDQRRQELNDLPKVLEAEQRKHVTEHASLLASFQQKWASNNRLGDYKPSATERENLDRLRTESAAQVAKIKGSVDTYPMIIQQLEERIANLKDMVAGRDKHEIMESHFARRKLGRLPDAAE